MKLMLRRRIKSLGNILLRASRFCFVCLVSYETCRLDNSNNNNNMNDNSDNKNN